MVTLYQLHLERNLTGFNYEQQSPVDNTAEYLYDAISFEGYESVYQSIFNP